MAKLETVDASVPTPSKRPAKRKKTFKKKRDKRVVHHGIVHIQASFNNTIITIADTEGNVVAWSSAGGIGFRGSRPPRRRYGPGTGPRPWACAPWTCASRAPAGGASPPFARCRPRPASA